MANAITGTYRNPGLWRTHVMQPRAIGALKHTAGTAGYVDLSTVTDVGYPTSRKDLDEQLRLSNKRKSRHRNRG